MLEKYSNDHLRRLADEIKLILKPIEISKLIQLISPEAPTGEMSSIEFDGLVNFLNAKGGNRGYSEKSIEVARLVLVMGASFSEAACESGLSKQSVQQLIKRIRRRVAELPSDWVCIREWYPSRVAKQLKEISVELRSAEFEGRPVEEGLLKIKIHDSA